MLKSYAYYDRNWVVIKRDGTWQLIFRLFNKEMLSDRIYAKGRKILRDNGFVGELLDFYRSSYAFFPTYKIRPAVIIDVNIKTFGDTRRMGC